MGRIASSVVWPTCSAQPRTHVSTNMQRTAAHACQHQHAAHSHTRMSATICSAQPHMHVSTNMQRTATHACQQQHAAHSRTHMSAPTCSAHHSSELRLLVYYSHIGPDNPLLYCFIGCIKHSSINGYFHHLQASFENQDKLFVNC